MHRALLCDEEDSEIFVYSSLGFVFKGGVLDLPSHPALRSSWVKPHSHPMASVYYPEAAQVCMWVCDLSQAPFNQLLSILGLPFSGHHPEILSQCTG